jgi:hypothetical protein
MLDGYVDGCMRRIRPEDCFRHCFITRSQRRHLGGCSRPVFCHGRCLRRAVTRDGNNKNKKTEPATQRPSHRVAHELGLSTTLSVQLVLPQRFDHADRHSRLPRTEKKLVCRPGREKGIDDVVVRLTWPFDCLFAKQARIWFVRYVSCIMMAESFGA